MCLSYAIVLRVSAVKRELFAQTKSRPPLRASPVATSQLHK